MSARIRAKIGQLVSDHSSSPYPDPDLMSWKFSCSRSAAACLSRYILEHSVREVAHSCHSCCACGIWYFFACVCISLLSCKVQVSIKGWYLLERALVFEARRKYGTSSSPGQLLATHTPSKTGWRRSITAYKTPLFCIFVKVWYRMHPKWGLVQNAS